MANLPVTFFSSVIKPAVTSPQLDLPLVSKKAKGIGYYGQSDGVHTVQYTTENSFIGIIKVQATLDIEAADKSWFDVNDTQLGDGITVVPDGAVVKSFTGNFIWVRTVIEQFESGAVNRILFSHN
jgi:hypothetical protein